jgi:hypothetical protein
MHMRIRPGQGRLFLLSILAVAIVGAAGFSFRHPLAIGVQRDGSIVVPNGQQLTPAGTHIEVNDRPLGMVLSPNRRLMAVVTGSNFNPRGLHLIDVNTQTVTQRIGIVCLSGTTTGPLIGPLTVGAVAGALLLAGLFTPVAGSPIVAAGSARLIQP